MRKAALMAFLAARRNNEHSGYGSPLSRGRQVESSIIRPEIIRDAVGGVERIEVVGIAIQQRAGLGLVIRRYIVGLLQRLAENAAVGVIGLPGADEDADAMLRFGIEIAHLVAELVNDKTMRRQRAHGFLTGGVVCEPDAESRPGEIEAVLFQERIARGFQCEQQRRAQYQDDGWKRAQGADAERPRTVLRKPPHQP